MSTEGNGISYEGLFSLKDRVALVVGAAAGLAGESCAGLAQFGATLALADVGTEALGKASSALKDRGIASWSHPVDVQDEASVASLFEAVWQRFGRIDILVNFAGVAAPFTIDQISTAEFYRVINVNLLGSFLLTKYSVERMVPQGSGKIILFGSVAGQIGRPNSSHYSASKGGVHSMVRTVAVETARKNIQINAIAPVFTVTPMASLVLDKPGAKEKIVSSIPMGRLGLPSDLVGAVIYLSGRASDFMTGQTIVVDGGCTIS
jgi:NAD(P)-dependent dehydrogenase (short-subunit alcohol dehydrogenase family)